MSRASCRSLNSVQRKLPQVGKRGALPRISGTGQTGSVRSHLHRLLPDTATFASSANRALMRNPGEEQPLWQTLKSKWVRFI
ncbi:hypothetical protein SETIT_1G279600v2 [Setaria italica]|uniref:Uncharacterized protein n=2 Tax=Setaria TaxID=4554 RepID=A0A368PPZ9_SETIT|nr:hypothetical protein SETIT_1G279600v2 [Setaria italica]TKW40999.1 hypothetical protein SEVIR_1G285000v2 [Setaria viridis]